MVLCAIQVVLNIQRVINTKCSLLVKIARI